MIQGRSKPTILLVDDEPLIRKGLSQAFELAGFEVFTYDSAEALLAESAPPNEPDRPTVLVSDVRLPGIDGLDLMQRWQALQSKVPVILITGHGDIQLAVEAMRLGAFDFIEKPFKPETVIDSVRRALELWQTPGESNGAEVILTAAAGSRDTEMRLLDEAIIGQSRVMQSLKLQILRFANVKADVLILGETGTGKEKLARALHDFGSRREQNFVAINCGALPASTIESELFGHEAGAFTDARARRIGKFEFAQGGTIFLDEIESMPLQLQTELLRVLQERRISRLGSNDEIAIDVRIIAATKIDLLAAADEGNFREDLFYRLNVLAMNLPPLRERLDDIPLLFERFVRQTAKNHHLPTPSIPSNLTRQLQNQRWSGNVRELENTAIRYVLTEGSDLFKSPGQSATAGNCPSNEGSELTLAEQVNQFEADVIQATLNRYSGDLRSTWEALGVSRRTLYDKMTRYGLTRSP